MTSLKDIIGELQSLSNRISTQVRTVALSLIIIIWGLLIGEAKTGLVITDDLKSGLLIVGVLALLAIFCDFLQYFFGYLNTDALRKKMEKEKLEESEYKYSDWRYKLRGFFFWIKQIFLIFAVILFLGIFIPRLY